MTHSLKRSQKQIAAARANGARSQGPVSPEGKARSSLNSLKHGLSAQPQTPPTLHDENPDTYTTFHQELLQELSPQSPQEHILAKRIISYYWRLERLQRLETELFDAPDPDADAENPEPNDLDPPPHRLALRFMRHHKTFQLFQRYETTLSRELNRALRDLSALQATRKKPTIQTNPRIPTQPYPTGFYGQERPPLTEADLYQYIFAPMPTTNPPAPRTDEPYAQDPRS